MPSAKLNCVPLEWHEPATPRRRGASLSSLGVAIALHAAAALALAAVYIVPQLPIGQPTSSEPITIGLAENKPTPTEPITTLINQPAPPQAQQPAPDPDLLAAAQATVLISPLEELVFEDTEEFETDWLPKPEAAEPTPQKKLASIPPKKPSRATSPPSKPAAKPKPKAKPSPKPRPQVLAKKRAQPTYTPKPAYPRSARQKSMEGTAYIRANISASGKVTSATLSKSSGHATLDAAARRAVTRWKFKPATQGGTAIASSVVVPVKFALR